MLNAVAAAALALSAVVAPPPQPITVDVLSVSGDGCAPGTAVVAPSADNTAFTVIYSDFVVQAHGPDVHKTCELTVRVNHPDDYTYGIAETDFRGFAQLGAGSRGVERASYFFAGLSPTEHSPHTFTGPMTDDWQATDQPGAGTVVHGPCREHRPLTIKVELRVVGKSGTSFMTMDSTDGSASAKFRLSWQKC
jgi:hypothetical protein